MTTDPGTLKDARAKLGLSQHDFGELLGVTKRTVSRWETGKSKIRSNVPLAIERLIDKQKKKVKR